MTGTNLPSFDFYRPIDSSRDASWYGTLGVIVACLGVLIASGFMG
jgi:hypothetical protein